MARVDRGVERFIRIARPRKADALRKMYAKHGDKVDIVVIEDLIKGDFTDALKGVSAVIHVATPLPGKEELKDILEVGHLPGHFPIYNLHQRFSDHQRGITQHRPSGCRRRCQTRLLHWNCRHPYGFVQSGG